MATDPPHDPLSDYVIGYPKLAARMGLRPESAIFRTFSTLNARNILYMQAELADLEIRFDKITKQDSMSKDPHKQQYATHYGFLSGAYEHADHGQLDIAMRIKVKLRDYNEALLQVHNLNKIVCPDEYDLHDIQAFLGCTDMGPFALDGEDAFFWGSRDSPKGFKSDMVALKERQKLDTFSKWVAERAMILIKCMGRCRKPSTLHGEVVIYDSTILKATFWITSIIASMIPIASIGVLIHLESRAARLGAIAAFNALITVCLNIFTEAKGTDCFAVTAAFTAVQIVFLGVEKGSDI